MTVNPKIISFERHQQIIKNAMKNGIVRAGELTIEFSIHEMMVGRDMDYLEQQGLFKQVYASRGTTTGGFPT